MSEKKLNPKLVAIREMLVDAVHEGLNDEKQRNKASFLNVAVSLLKMHGGPEELKTEDEIKAGIEAVRAAYVGNHSGIRLPFRSSDANEKPNTRPSASTSTPVPSILDDQDDADDQD
jgi:hypothetical protein